LRNQFGNQKPLAMPEGQPRFEMEHSTVLNERIQRLSTDLHATIGDAVDSLREEREKLFDVLNSERQALLVEVENRKEQLDRREADLEARERNVRQNMERFTSRDGCSNDVIKINCGGELFSVTRSTLAVFDDSYLANLFSGRWDSSIERDATTGAFFLDFDPVSFRLIVNYLRDLKIASPANPPRAPRVAKERADHFANLLDFLGLASYIPFDVEGQNDGYKIDSVRSMLSKIGNWRSSSVATTAVTNGSPASATSIPASPTAVGEWITNATSSSVAAISSAMPASKSIPREVNRVTDAPDSVGRADLSENNHRDGWRFTQFDGFCQLDESDSSVLSIADTRMEGRAGAVRANASLNNFDIMFNLVYVCLLKFTIQEM
jgi:hypothetical protein